LLSLNTTNVTITSNPTSEVALLDDQNTTVLIYRVTLNNSQTVTQLCDNSGQNRNLDCLQINQVNNGCCCCARAVYL
jgi:hypothetical protein